MANSNFGTGGILGVGIIACLAASVWIGPMGLVSMGIWIASYHWMMKQANRHFNPDGSRKKRN